MTAISPKSGNIKEVLRTLQMNHLAGLRQKIKELAHEENTSHAAQKFQTARSQGQDHRPAVLRFGAALVVIALLGVVSLATGQSLAHIKLAGITIQPHAEISEVVRQLKNETKDYKLTVETPDHEKLQYTLAEAGIKIDFNKSAQTAVNAKDDQPWYKNIQWWHAQNLPLVTYVNTGDLNDFIYSKAAVTLKPYKNASLKVEDGRAVINDSQTGESLAVASRHTILDSVKYLKTSPLKQHKVFRQAKVSRGDLRESSEELTAILKSPFAFSISGRVIEPSPKQVGEWLSVNVDESKKRADISLDKPAFDNYLSSITASYVSSGRTEVIIDGVTVIPGEGGYGIDKSQAAGLVSQAIKEGHGISQELPVTNSSYKTVNVKASDKLILADLTRKRLYAVQGQAIVQSFASSAGAPATPTVTGNYAIYRKFEKQDMRGANADGSDYFQPNVQWINYFYRDYAVHGNYWRPASYFGNINSSHGCVGLPNDQAKWVYDWAPVGTPVTVFT